MAQLTPTPPPSRSFPSVKTAGKSTTQIQWVIQETLKRLAIKPKAQTSLFHLEIAVIFIKNNVHSISC